MAKQKTQFYCQNCGSNSAKWIGKCPSCGEWNTYVEEVIQKSDEGGWSAGNSEKRKAVPTRINEITTDALDRWSSGNSELDRVLGGGIVKGSLVLVGGEPGIGKSTLLLQVSISLPKQKVLYISGEESPQQIKMRADRIGVSAENCFLVSETNVQEIFIHVNNIEPDMVVVDSIQTVFSSALEAAPGTISQVRECAGLLMRYAKESNVPVFLIGHINKEGSIAGPKVLEHMVDTVLQFEGDRHHFYRLLRTSKNRFGSTSELGIYQMRESGLEIVENPSDILLSSIHDNSGVTVGTTLEGNRPLLIEVQALVSPATFGTPQRSATGFDVKRLHMLLAVLEKRLGLRLGVQDVFLNITGGIKVTDPSIDLAVCAAIYSSYQDQKIDPKQCFVGEVGLGGEIRPVHQLGIRLSEVEKMGFENVYLSGEKNQEDAKSKIKKSKISSLRRMVVELGF